ncbi:unnamed protein product, partial [Vitis vinifera]|uniref:Uncharacterized protein n=1 Tax=Vitis vinifera TaxID=29760 RepID=D7UC56_VITVI
MFGGCYVFHHFFTPSLYKSLCSPHLHQFACLNLAVLRKHTAVEKARLQEVRVEISHDAVGYPRQKLPDSILLRYIHQSATFKVAVNFNVVVDFLSKSSFAKATHPHDGHHSAL